MYIAETTAKERLIIAEAVNDTFTSLERAHRMLYKLWNAILDREEIYSGCFCRFSVNLYPFSTNGNNGVAVGLNNVQKICDGERLAGGSRAEDDFDDGYEGDGDLDDIL